MREIKFRAWDEEDRVMRDVAGIHWGIGIIEFYDEDLESGTYDLNKFKIMQYIGSKDKNDKEIYRCDIVRDTKYPEQIFVVGWCEGGFRLKCIKPEKCRGMDERIDCCDEMEIIGNIPENPELMDKK